MSSLGVGRDPTDVLVKHPDIESSHVFARTGVIVRIVVRAANPIQTSAGPDMSSHLDSHEDLGSAGVTSDIRGLGGVTGQTHDEVFGDVELILSGLYCLLQVAHSE
jgi:hypothetical protein